MPEMVFKPEALELYGLPDIGYPISIDGLDQMVGAGDDLPFALMLHGLQQASAAGDADWMSYEPAMVRLAELIAPQDGRTEASAAGAEWWIEIAPVDLTGPIVTIQRGEALIAAMASREDGRLRLAAYRPLDANSAEHIIALALRPYGAEGTVCMRANNWEYALDCSASTGQFYAADRGQSYLTNWLEGMGRREEVEVDPTWLAAATSTPRPASTVAIELGVAYAHSER
ncbi:hypothetical protein [Novosphingobium sp. Gsoil 351]|uniref:hypothetical protein n=1 Tax=Novosphingobium sp. Gsoil 351 TaxID=2675225 RepID=UPI0012B4CCB0|nr:hypothetical protein [Novosphingobium sp. Gsoil 351]QGN54174.1 hypothetical protein GKE62_06065 [Novosphingobium sp. Gsoil 351]